MTGNLKPKDVQEAAVEDLAEETGADTDRAVETAVEAEADQAVEQEEILVVIEAVVVEAAETGAVAAAVLTDNSKIQILSYS